VLVVTGAVAAGVALTWTACATSQPSHAQVTRERLEQFSSALAHAGMSVPVPPRVCDEPVRSDAVMFDDDVGCVSVPEGAATDDAVRIYARAIVARRVPEAPEMRADLLVDAWRNDDPQFASMATSIESDFDARRAASKVKPKKPPPIRDAKASGSARARPTRDVVDAGSAPLDGGAPVRAASERRERDVVDAGPAATDAGTLTTRERIVGTWTARNEGANVVVVYALCGSGDLVVRYEATGERTHLFDVEPVRGTWEVTEGEPPTFTLIIAGERQEGPINKLTDDAAEVTFDDETIALTRRSKSANCE
jgi:hypothetical protein